MTVDVRAGDAEATWGALPVAGYAVTQDRLDVPLLTGEVRRFHAAELLPPVAEIADGERLLQLWLARHWVQPQISRF